MHHQLAILTADLGIDDRMLGNLVVVVGIVGGVLVTPFDFAVARAQGEHAGCPFVVARSIFGIPVRAGVANALIENVGLGIVGSGFPHRAAPVFVALLAVLPGF